MSVDVPREKAADRERFESSGSISQRRLYSRLKLIGIQQGAFSALAKLFFLSRHVSTTA